MLAAPGLSSYGFTFDNWGANPSLTPGTSIVPGASSVEGSWTRVAASTDISRNVYWLSVWVGGGNTSTATKDHLLDIGFDPAGGTSYAAAISDIVCGESAPLTVTAGAAPSAGGHQFLFPLFIPSGSSVAVRIQGSNATAGTVRVAVKFYGDPSNPENIPVGQYSETIGTLASSAGVSFTPGNAADGTWVSLGSTLRDMWWWQLCVQLTNSTITAHETYVDLAYGDATNKILLKRELYNTTTAESLAAVLNSNSTWIDSYAYVPSGTNIYVRGRCDSAPDTGWNAVAIGIGG
jgi:hypothetical protein